MAKYRKKPVVIEAIQWLGNNFEDIKEFAGNNVEIDSDSDLIVKTLEDGGTKAAHVATIGDYIIKGVQGEFYFCKPDIFKQTYEQEKEVGNNNTVLNGIIINGEVYKAVAVDDITCKCCTDCAFEHNHGDCPSIVGKYLQRKMNVGIIFKKVIP